LEILVVTVGTLHINIISGPYADW